jgi:release factor glutamine methyltransferase
VIKVSEAIARARDALLAAGIPAAEAPGDAEVLARHVLDWDLTQFALHRHDAAPDGFADAYRTAIGRRARREPVSQITGCRQFWGLDFEVTRDVLTPRPETETLIETALAAFPRDARIVIMDVGTGSGCIAIALATEFPNAHVIASDVSLPALTVARRNAARHGVADRIAFVLGRDLAGGVDVDLIVSNPPYIARRDADSLPLEVREYEPHVALFGGEDGLEMHRTLIASGRRSLREQGRMIVELGYDQAPAVTAIARAAAWDVDAVRRDLQGVERAMMLRPTKHGSAPHGPTERA